MKEQPTLEVSNLTKQYPGTLALSDVSISFETGRVHALLGKNGAGKSTLVKILSGALSPSSGFLELDGRRLNLGSTGQARAAGIATVYQELSLVPELSVAENMYMGRLPMKSFMGFACVDWVNLYKNAHQILSKMGVDLDVKKPVSSLAVAEQQVVEIAKGMTVTPRVLILDEPTSALSNTETTVLFALIKRLATAGVVVVYITHRLQELRLIADDITVLRDGRKVETVEVASVSNEDIVAMLFGDSQQKPIRAESRPGDEVVLSVKGLGRHGFFNDVSFDVAKGEVLGIAGMLGAGRTELLRAIYGLEGCDSGEVWVGGRKVRKPNPELMKRFGLAFISENRKEEGLVLSHSIARNMGMASLQGNSRWGVLHKGKETSQIAKYIEQLAIKLSSTHDCIDTLSGGNQQKCIIGSWLMTEPRVILFDEPTRGIDVAAKQQIFSLICQLAQGGISSIVVSSELEELEICHRVLIMKGGTIERAIPAREVSAQGLFVACMGE